MRWPRRGFNGYGAGLALPVDLLEVEDLDDDVRARVGEHLGRLDRGVVTFRSTDDPRSWAAVRIGRTGGVLSVTGLVLAPPLETCEPQVLKYISGRARLPRAIAGVLAALGAVNVGGTLDATVEEAIAGPTANVAPGVGGRFLSPHAGDRISAARSGMRWPFAQRVLAADSDPTVRAALAERADVLRADTIDTLAADRRPRVRATLARSADRLPETVRFGLVRDSSPVVRRDLTSFGALRGMGDDEIRVLLRDPDPSVALAVIHQPGRHDLSLAAHHRDADVRFAAAIAAWGQLDDDAQERLRTDPDTRVAAAASPALRCRAYLSVADAADHATMFDPAADSTARLDAISRTVGKRPWDGNRGDDDEQRHARCVVEAIVHVVDALDPNATETSALTDRATTLAFAELRNAFLLPSRHGSVVGTPSRALRDQLRNAGPNLTGDALATWMQFLEVLEDEFAALLTKAMHQRNEEDEWTRVDEFGHPRETVDLGHSDPNRWIQPNQPEHTDPPGPPGPPGPIGPPAQPRHEPPPPPWCSTMQPR
jgi:hypothetical protein